MSSDGQVFILGGHQTDFARNWGRENKHISAMMRETFAACVEATKVEPGAIDAFCVGNFASELYCMQAHLGAFCVELDPAVVGKPTWRVEAACASGSLAVLSGMASILAGLYDLVCVIGVEQMKTVPSDKGGDFLGTAAWYEREAKGIEFPFPKLFGKLGDIYHRRYGLEETYLARIATINYENARRNPNAQTRDWFMSYEHASSISAYNGVVGGMITVSDCSQVTDGAVCILICSRRYAEEYARRRGLSVDGLPRILGWGHTTAPVEFSRKIQASEGSEYVLPHTRTAIVDAFRRARVANCWALSCIETHDCFTTSEYMAIDHFGLTAPGESWKAIEEGTIMLGGKLPVNPSGGLIGCGHPVGATGVRQVLDAYKQVNGSAGDYQIDGADTVATLNMGGTATTNVCVIVGR